MFVLQSYFLFQTYTQQKTMTFQILKKRRKYAYYTADGISWTAAAKPLLHAFRKIAMHANMLLDKDFNASSTNYR